MAYAPEYETVHARWYDGVYASRGADAAFYRTLARETGSPVLELGCGTGRVLLPIARDGLDCVGLDGSPAMLDALRAKRPPANLRLVVAPMQDFDLAPARFRLIFAAFRPFQHLYTVADQLACLAGVHRHLASGGLFAFDVFQPDLARLAVAEEPELEEARFRDGDDEIVRLASVRRDLATQTQEVTMRFERRRGGEVVGDEVERFRMRWYHRYEVEHLLARAGFEVVALYGDLDRRPFDRDAKEMVFVARAYSDRSD
ncbi:MAG: class I SAM-dependent methyltransferase [Actinobacteria bacterium]|nr:class I SAM-dependent methyltransferase [Actinomycetota bacterium]